ncbi:hypothetical protein MMC10_005412 [Thelotrema lepadinum]|nr:hypothetical protein [Thelotrema lepadinum]
MAKPLTFEKLPFEIRLLIYSQIDDDEPLNVPYWAGIVDRSFFLCAREDIKVPLNLRALVTLPRVSHRFRDDILFLTKQQRGIGAALKWSRVIFRNMDDAMLFTKTHPNIVQKIQVATLFCRIWPQDANASTSAQDRVSSDRQSIKFAFPAISRLEVVLNETPRSSKHAQIVLANTTLHCDGRFRLRDDEPAIKAPIYFMKGGRPISYNVALGMQLMGARSLVPG